MTSPGHRRVVVTGLGALTPLGNSADAFWAAAVAGRSGIRPFKELDASAYPCQVAGEVQDFDPTEYMDRKTARRMARFSQFAVATAWQAARSAQLDLDAIDRERAGIICGNGGGGYPNVEQACRAAAGAATGDRVVVFGSFHTVAAALQIGLGDAHYWAEKLSTLMHD